MWVGEVLKHWAFLVHWCPEIARGDPPSLVREARGWEEGERNPVAESLSSSRWRRKLSRVQLLRGLHFH